MDKMAVTQRVSNTLFVRNLPYNATNKDLEDLFSEIGPVKTAFVIKDKGSSTCKGFGYVKYSLLDDAMKACGGVTHCNGRKIFVAFSNAKKRSVCHRANRTDDNSQLESSVDEESLKKKLLKAAKQKPLKRCRLIVRNLNFECDESHLRSEFQRFGELHEINLPMKNNGNSNCGFAFIQYKDVKAADKAVTEMNEQQIEGRTIAVDWAVSKDRFRAQTLTKAPSLNNDLDISLDGDEGNAQSTASPVECITRETGSSECSSVSDLDNDPSSVDAGNEGDDGVMVNDEEEDSDISGESVGKEGESSEYDGAELPKVSACSQHQPKMDVGEGRTLFIRNLPFDIGEDELSQVFDKYGELCYARLVTDKLTGHPKGTGFVQFKSKADADNCLQGVQSDIPGEQISFNGRSLMVMPAISRSDAQDLRVKKSTKEAKDSRNLFLAREGLIREGTEQAIGMSKEDMKKRMKVEQTKRMKLKNIDVYVSSTRICVHNLPTNVTDDRLRKLLRQIVDEPSVRITECRVMRDLKSTPGSKKGRSLGYAFVNFTMHSHALKALRGLNSSQIFGDKKRPIVDFSLENRKAVEVKERRKQRSKELAAKRKAGDVGNSFKGLSQPPPKKLKVGKRLSEMNQETIARSIYKGPKGLPKKMGPKIRHRHRGEYPKTMKKQKLSKHVHGKDNSVPKVFKKKKRKEITDKTDQLIQKITKSRY